jgi:Zn-finger nucleic acid-binding protein
MCPNGDGRLQRVAARDRQGQPVLIDQCPTCGGIWFDRFELFRVDEKQAAELDRLDSAALRHPAGIAEDPRCPRCQGQLRVFRDRFLPANIQMLICDECDGLWLNHGALAGYADFRQQHKMTDAAARAKLAADYEKLLKAGSSADYWNGMARLGHELGGGRDVLTGLPLDGTPDQLAKIDAAQDIAFGFLRTAARLLFGI